MNGIQQITKNCSYRKHCLKAKWKRFCHFNKKSQRYFITKKIKRHAYVRIFQKISLGCFEKQALWNWSLKLSFEVQMLFGICIWWFACCDTNFCETPKVSPFLKLTRLKNDLTNTAKDSSNNKANNQSNLNAKANIGKVQPKSK